MLYIRNGALKLNIKDTGMDILWDISLFLLFITSTILYPGSSEFYRLLHLFGLGLLCFVSVTEIFSGKGEKKDIKLRISLITIWYVLFLIFANLSAMWAYSVSGVLHYSDALIKVALMGFCLSQHIDTEEKLYKSMKLFIFTCIVSFVYSLVVTPRDLWFTGDFEEVTGQSISILGLCAAFAMVMSVYFAMAEGKKHYYIAAAINFIFVVSATSRKALFFAIMGVVLLELLYTWRKNYFFSLVTILIAIGLFTLIVLKSGISDAMNQRLMSMYNYFTGGAGKKDTSLSLRQYLISTAGTLFYKNPMIGVGMGNFSYFLDDIYGEGVYAHNNYLEIMADLGVVGFLLYYWFYAYLLIKLLGQTIRKHKLSLLFLVVMISFMVIEYGQVTYYQYSFQLIVAFAYCAVCITDGVESGSSEGVQQKEDIHQLDEYYRLVENENI
ncbi:MAG: O-antigen ligase family protein [Clostridiales bacterium]|nr:O-antigen ligase family protein [Clostridiales bacterium]